MGETPGPSGLDGVIPSPEISARCCETEFPVGLGSRVGDQFPGNGSLGFTEFSRQKDSRGKIWVLEPGVCAWLAGSGFEIQLLQALIVL